MRCPRGGANVLDAKTKFTFQLSRHVSHSRGSIMNCKKAVLFWVCALGITFASFSSAQTTPAQKDDALADQIRAIASRPEYKHSAFGVEVYSLDDEKVVFALHGQELFTPGST